MILLQRIQPFQIVSSEMQDECGQKTRGPTIAVIVGMDRGKLIVRDAGPDRDARAAISNDVLAVAIRRRSQARLPSAITRA
jgi:hypothetical protein